jgi:hypothetical protein
MERRRLIAMLLVGVVLLVGATMRWRAERPVWALVGVASNGDTVWLDVSDHTGEFWGARVRGPVTDDAWPVVRVRCAQRTTTETNRAAALELSRAIADTACAHP